MKQSNRYTIKPIRSKDREWVSNFLTKYWISPEMTMYKKTYYADQLPGFILYDKDKKKIGLITYCIEGSKCTIVTLNSLIENKGVGSSLINALKTKALSLGCKKLSVSITNANLRALRFYQKRGFNLVKIYPKAMEKIRKKKPKLPLIESNGIKIQDEILLEMPLL